MAETLIYAAIFVVLIGAIVNSVILLSSSYRHISETRSIHMSALASMDRMTREIRRASSVDGSGTSYNVPGGALLLDTGARFYLSEGQIMMSKDGTVAGPLTQGGTTVGTLIFRPIDTGNSAGVKIEMIVEDRHFYNTVMLRGSY